MANASNYYRILNISKHASQTDIKHAFRRLAREFHPDLHPNNPEAAAKFKQISEAYEVLGDPERRSHYDTRFEDTTAEPKTSASGSYSKLYQQAQDKLSRREYQDAIQTFTQAIALSPDSVEAYLGRCQAYDAIQNDRAVLDDCFQILQRDSKSAQAYLYQGQARLRLGYVESAIDAYTQAIALEDSFALAYVRRAQARLELPDKVLAYPDVKRDLLTAKMLYRAQRNWTQVQHVERMFRGLKLPMPSTSATSLHARSTTQSDFINRAVDRVSLGNFPPSKTTIQRYLALALGKLPSIVLNPSDNLLPTFAKLGPAPAAWTGLLYGLIGAVSLLPISATSQMTPFGFMREELWKVGLMGCTAYMGLAVASTLARLLMGGRGSFAGDLFVAGVAALPMAATILGSGIALNFGIVWVILMIATAYYSILILYIGCTQIGNINEPKARVSVLGMIFASFSASALVARFL
jgi:curved DNA-binding protein CbpA